MSRHEQIEPIGVACASGRHEPHPGVPGHLVYLLDEITGICTPPCDAARYNRRCHHVTEAREKRARRLERERMREARELRRLSGSWLDDIDFASMEEQIAIERALVAEGMRE